MRIRQSDNSAGIPALVCAPYAALIVAVLLAYANVYTNDFLFDDSSLITGNKFLTSWHYVGALFVTPAVKGIAGSYPFPYYRPLLLFIYLLVYQAAGPSTVAFHALNIALHVVNACLLYTLGIRLGFQRGAGLLATLLWALHPIQTEAVTFMSCTGDLVCGMFLLSGILVLSQEFNVRRVAGACLLFAAALLAKETAVVFPLLAMGLLFYRSENRWLLRTYLKTWPFWLIAIVYLLARLTVLNFGFNAYFNDVAHNTTIVERVYTSLATLPTYLRLLVWPTCLHIERTFQIFTIFWSLQVLAGFAILLIIFIIIAWKPARHATPLSWGLLWALAVHIPQSGVLVKADAPIFEHWLYLPTMGLTLGLGESLARLTRYCHLQKRQGVLAVLMVFLAGLLSAMTFEQNKTWHDPVAFYTHIFACGEDSGKARNELGIAYAQRGEYALAITQFHLSMAVPGYHAAAPCNLGIAMLRLDHDPTTIAESMKYFQRAIDIDSEYFQAYDAMADAYALLGDHVKEIEYRAEAAEIRRKLGIN